jgi:hypothetical protein
MNWKTACIGLLASVATADAFTKSPNAFGIDAIKNKVAKQIRELESSTDFVRPPSSSTSSASSSGLWRPTINNMVAGGAERAYGDDYYDGRFIPGFFFPVVRLHSSLIQNLFLSFFHFILCRSSYWTTTGFAIVVTT